MYQFTTPRIGIKMPNELRVADISNGVIVLSQKNKTVLEKEETDWLLDTPTNKIYIRLSQEETGSFSVGNLNIQVHFAIGDEVYATQSMETKVYKNQHQEVLTNE